MHKNVTLQEILDSFATDSLLYWKPKDGYVIAIHLNDGDIVFGGEIGYTVTKEQIESRWNPVYIEFSLANKHSITKEEMEFGKSVCFEYLCYKADLEMKTRTASNPMC